MEKSSVSKLLSLLPTISTFTSVCPYNGVGICPDVLPHFKFLQLYHNMVLTKVDWCFKIEKYAFSVTLRPLGSMRWGEAELRISRPISLFCHLSSVGPNQQWALAHLGCTHEVLLISFFDFFVKADKCILVRRCFNIALKIYNDLKLALIHK